jgi:hypothetical protein
VPQRAATGIADQRAAANFRGGSSFGVFWSLLVRSPAGAVSALAAYCAQCSTQSSNYAPLSGPPFTSFREGRASRRAA